MRGAELKAGAANIHAEGSFSSIAVYDTTSRTTIHEDSGNWIKGGSTTTKNWSSGKALGNSIETTGELSISGNKEVYLQSTKLKAGKDGKRNIYITSNEGKIIFDTATEWDSYSSKKEGRGAFWKTDKGHGHSGTTEKDNNLQGNIKLYAKKGVKLSYVKEKKEQCFNLSIVGTICGQRNETEAEAKARLQEEGGWQSQVIAQSSNTTLTGKANTHNEWEYNASGMTAEAQFVVAAVIVAATGGAGAAALGTTGLGAAAVGGAIGAGAAYAGTNFINSAGKAGGAGVGAILQNTVNTAISTTEETLQDENFYREMTIGALSGMAVYGIDRAAGVGNFDNKNKGGIGRADETSVYTTKTPSWLDGGTDLLPKWNDIFLLKEIVIKQSPIQFGVHVGSGLGVDYLFNQAFPPPREENNKPQEFTPPSSSVEDYLRSIDVLSE